MNYHLSYLISPYLSVRDSYLSNLCSDEHHVPDLSLTCKWSHDSRSLLRLTQMLEASLLSVIPHSTFHSRVLLLRVLYLVGISCIHVT